MIGERHGKLVILSETIENRTTIARVVCDCGTVKVVRRNNMRSGRTQSCGCHRLTFNLKHGESDTRLYKLWVGMMNRCHVKPTKHYGLRGITVCPEWRRDFLVFKEWALTNGYADMLTIERDDNDKGYGPDNCRWATKLDQARNKRTVKLTLERVKLIKRALLHSRPCEVSRQFELSPQTINSIRTGRTWADVAP